MKKMYFVFVVIFIMAMFVAKESVFSQNQENYYSICNKWENYFNSHPGLKLEEDGDYMNYIRWKEFWRTRVNNGDSTHKGDFELYRRGFDDYTAHLSTYQQSTTVFSDWHFLGPHQHDILTQNMGQICSICVDTVSDKTLKTIYVGTNSSGIWRTVDGGKNWNNITDNTSSYNGIAVNGVTDILVDPNNANILYASASSGFISDYHNTSAGVIKSSDGGLTWQVLFHPSYPNNISTIYGILVDPNHTKRIFALCDATVYRTMDGGITWNAILQVPSVPPVSDHAYRYVRNIVMKPGNADTVYIATDCNNGRLMPNFYRIINPYNSPNTIISTDLTSQLPLPPAQNRIYSERLNVAVTPASPDIIYVACKFFLSDSTKDDSTKLCVWKYSKNLGWRLEIESNALSCAIEMYNGLNDSKFEFLASPSDTNVLYIGGLTFEKLVKSAGSWGVTECLIDCQLCTNYHDDTRKAKILKGIGNDILYVGNDGGISVSVNGAQTWSNLNGNGLNITQFHAIGGSNSIPQIILGGSQDNQFWKDSSGVWTHHEGGDWGNIVVDPTSPNYMYGWDFGSASGLTKSANYGSHWDPAHQDTSFVKENKMYNPPMLTNPLSKTFYIGAQNLYRSYNRTGSWEKIVLPYSSHGMAAIAIAPSDTSVMYVAFSDPSNWWDPGKKFLRSKDNGQSWKNLTDTVGWWVGTKFDSLLTAFGITDIAVKANDPKTLWISFDGFETQWDNARVLVSHDSGYTWSNYSNGLPNFPINCLRYMNSTNDRLFAGTDVGMFYIDNSLSQWQPFNTGLPLCVIEDMEINDNIKKIRAGTYGRGIWETTLDCEYYPNSPIEITQNTTWAADTALNTNLFIDSSFTLTLLRNTVKMPPLAKIYIKQGGRLIVNGATITNKCANMWQGIEVWGRKDKPQNSRYQGWITLENGALIENARIGITTSNSTVSDFWNTSGGIIGAQNSTFRNNYKAVEFYYNDYGQYSSFRKVNFETTGSFVDGTSTPSDFVSMLSTTGVSFYGCNFRNTTTDTSSVPLPVAGRGIYSVNSTYTVDQYYYCPSQLVPCPNPVITPSSFSGLYYGIRAINTNPLSLFSVNNTNFEKNFRGIYASEMSQPQITLCNFTIPHQSPKVDTIYGLYLGKSTGYKVQENLFRSPGNVLLISNMTSFACRAIGIVVDNSGTLSNEIYKNTFQTMDIGINAQRLNKSTVGDSGLVLKCNKYNNNSYDQVITRQIQNDVEGIAAKQGASTAYSKDAAGNTFSPLHHTYQVNESDIKNQGDNLIYFHHIEPISGSPRYRPDYSTPAPAVTKSEVNHSYDTATCCLSKLTTGGGLPMMMSAQLSLEQTKVDSLTTVLNSVVDGGNTDGLNATVFFSQPSQALQVRQDLLNQSPYLSDTVMKTAIDKENVLPNEMVRDVLVANPQSAKSDNVLNELNTRFVPMPDSLLGEIMNGQDSLSDKEAIEANLSLHNLNLQYAFDELVRYYKTDTINPEASHDSLMILLAREQNPVAQYMLAFEYYYLGDWKNVNSVLNNMSNNFHFTSVETKQHQDYLQYFSFLKSLSDQGRTIYQLSTGNIDSIQQLIVNASEPVKSYAQNILEANNLLKYYEPILLPKDLKSAPDKKSIKTMPFSKSDWLHVFPNPARQYVIVEYNLADKISSQQTQIVFSVSTLDGKSIETRLLSKPQDQFLVNTTNYSPGVFLFTIQLSGKTVSTKKVTISN